MLFSTAYLPPCSYFSKLMAADEVIIEQHEHYIKQTYRNRIEIYGANGMLPLVIPVDHHNLFSIPINAVRISYEQPWQKIHWRSITSAYRNSPYFEYYEDELKGFYETQYEQLFAWNHDLLMALLRITGVEKTISFTGSWQKQYDTIEDLRHSFIPGKKQIQNPEAEYRQVFSERHGFIAGLSIIDVIFNLGPKAKEYLGGN